MKELKVLMIPTDRMPYMKFVSGRLENLQKIVGGNIEVVNLFDKALMVVNEEGKLDGSVFNYVASDLARAATNGDMIFGDVFLCGQGKEDFEDISEYVREIIYPRAVKVWEEYEKRRGLAISN